VGNKSATFPLQLLGIDVSAINSVQFACHTGYEHKPKGHVLNGDDLLQLLGGLKENGLADFSYLLTGYIGNVDFLRVVLDVLSELRANNSSVAYHCDPVLGDHGKLYVPEALVQVYKEQVVPVAGVLTPNQFEAELLSDVTISSLPSALAALEALHAKGTNTVVMTSGDISSQQCLVYASSTHTPLPPAAAAAEMVAIVSCPWDRVAHEAHLWSEEDRSAAPHARYVTARTEACYLIARPAPP
jgi:pyridoxine kinase